MAVFGSRVKVATSDTGTASPVNLGAAQPGFQTPAAAGVPDKSIVEYGIEDGSNFEDGWGLLSGTTLTRNVRNSSSGNAAINLSGSASVFVTVLAEGLAPYALMAHRAGGGI